MGIPGLFVKIIENRRYKDVHYGLKNGEVDCDSLYIDFNQIIYKSYIVVSSQREGKTLEEFENILILEVVRYTIYLICDVMKPKKLTYISIDGTCSRSKMIQQRSRRYKSYFIKIRKQREYQQQKIPMETEEWDQNANIAPGTIFMNKLNKKLLETMKKKQFQKHNPHMQVILSDSTIPGEAEHKYLSWIKKGDDSDKVYIYGKDADLIIIGIILHRRNVFIFRETDLESNAYLKNIYCNTTEFLIIHLDELKKGFCGDIHRSIHKNKLTMIQEKRFIDDYMFLTFMAGNDYVPSLYFMKMKKNGIELLISIYLNLKKENKGYEYLVDVDNLDKNGKINQMFLMDIWKVLSDKEETLMREQYQKTIKELKGHFRPDERRQEKEKDLSPMDIWKVRFDHLNVSNPDHPLYKEYKKDFLKMNYMDENWREQYYKEYLHIEKSESDYGENMKMMIQNYIESLLFTMEYYYRDCPSWSWHYRYRVAPLPSDIYHYLKEESLNDIHFHLGQNYTPYQQLMLILPPQMNFILPKEVSQIMNEEEFGCIPYYPTEARLDVSVGVKTMYSDMILPEIDEEKLLEKVNIQCELLEGDEKERNINKKKPYTKLGTK